MAVQAQPIDHDAAAPLHPLLLHHHRHRRHLQQQPRRPRGHQEREGESISVMCLRDPKYDVIKDKRSS